MFIYFQSEEECPLIKCISNDDRILKCAIKYHTECKLILKFIRNLLELIFL